MQLITERAFLCTPSIHVGMKAEVTGSFSDSEFRMALKKTGIKHPLLQSKIYINDKNDALYRIQPDMEIPVTFYNNADHNQWEPWYQENDNQPFDIQNGPLIRFAVFRCPLKNIIIILGHHLLGDGLSYQYLVNDLLSILNEDFDKKVLTPTLICQGTELPEGSHLSSASRFLIRNFLNKRWNRKKTTFSTNDYYTIFDEYRIKRGPQFLIQSLNKKQTKILIERCKNNYVSVNEAIVTAFSTAVQIHDPQPRGKYLEVGVAINVRNELCPPVGKCMGNFVSGIIVKSKVKESARFQDKITITQKLLVRKIKNLKHRFAALSFLQEIEPSLIESIYFLEYGDFRNRISRIIAHLIGERETHKGIGFTNLGKIKDEHLNGKFRLEDLVFIQPAYPANKLNVGVITANGKMNFCLRFFKDETSHENVQKIYNSAIQLIEKWE